jgi:hypothetical protein
MAMPLHSPRRACAPVVDVWGKMGHHGPMKKVRSMIRLRVTPDLAAKIKAQADDNRRSLNAEITLLLERAVK